MGLAKQTIDLDEEVSDDDDLAIDVSEKEPLFLKGQTTKGGIVLSPVRVVKNPEGTL
jgi:ATP-dependent RNA helicase DHX8/PRP22